MSNTRIVLLDGRRSDDNNLNSTFSILTDVLQASGHQVQVFSLRAMKIAHCIGCFACWLETPGICRYGEAGQGILQAVMHSDTIILFTPVTFGGYSSQLKQILDRFASLVLPYFRSYGGEMHHAPRYAHYPRWIGIGVQDHPNLKEAALFKFLVGRNAINFHAPSYAAEVIQNTEDSNQVRQTFHSLLSRKDRLPWGAAIKPLMPTPDAITNHTEANSTRRACLIVGSAKTLSPSTSGVLGNYVLERLKEQGWEIESLTLKANLRTEQGQAALFTAVDRADLLLFAFPLYIDTLPFLMTQALELITHHRRVGDHPRSQRLFVIANNGFVEAYQNNLALSICRNFAVANGMTWVGALAMGAGEAISGGEPLKPLSSFGIPCANVMHALDTASAALARGLSVPTEAVSGIAQNPIPHAPFAFYRWIATKTANKQMWEKRAAAHGISRQATFARPYA